MKEGSSARKSYASIADIEMKMIKMRIPVALFFRFNCKTTATFIKAAANTVETRVKRQVNFAAALSGFNPWLTAPRKKLSAITANAIPQQKVDFLSFPSLRRRKAKYKACSARRIFVIVVVGSFTI